MFVEVWGDLREKIVLRHVVDASSQARLCFFFVACFPSGTKEPLFPYNAFPDSLHRYRKCSKIVISKGWSADPDQPPSNGVD